MNLNLGMKYLPFDQMKARVARLLTHFFKIVDVKDKGLDMPNCWYSWKLDIHKTDPSARSSQRSKTISSPAPKDSQSPSETKQKSMSKLLASLIHLIIIMTHRR